MAAKKETPHTFEYFKTSEVFINGRFKEYVDKMWVQNKVQESMVKRLVDLYAIAAVIGLRIKRRLPDDRAGDDKRRTIQMMQLTDTYQTLAPIMKLVLMLDESRGLNEEERIRSAFRIPETKEEHDAGMESLTAMPEVASSICMRCWLCALEPLMMNMVTSGSITFLHC